VKFIKVISINNIGQLEIVKSLLQSFKIPYYVTNENFASLYGEADGLTQMDIMVREDKIEEAEDILKDFL